MTAVTEGDIFRSEMRWALAVGLVVLVIFAAILWSAFALHRNPPSNVELVDPAGLHLSPEFTESNLGTTVGSDGRITTRVVMTQFAFVPRCVVVPQGKPVTLRFATPDVIHGVLVTGTNVNTMVIPGYVSQVRSTFNKTGDLLMPCHEYCGLGHSAMIATVRVVPEPQFKPDASGKVSCAANG